MKWKMIVLLLLVSKSLFAKNEILFTCSDAKSEFINLNEGSKNGYKKENLELVFTIDEKTEDIFVNGTKLHKLGLSSNIFQFLEPVLSGHYVLYTFHKDSSILTIQKSYKLFNDPVMVNIYLKCK
ncbi:hypothetical protein [Aliarcobacter butzleri]|uniref:hypothetical protein n=1 Tax=Aliarcobacter butzleri TaxID=28197 RepID=UPI00214C0955|nr:hypothetical protein [Aliarcobacter butzleri]MCP3649529.1 hypothetical protein [Arcobacter sp. DNRA7]MCR1815702.1 hypothetical protein [Aliarcobacter butzleri]